jgi:mannose-6-phosphate isomerase-like protein (cupin superfamily)
MIMLLELEKMGRPYRPPQLCVLSGIWRIMKYQALNFKEKLSLFNEQWKPKVIAEMNDYQFKIVKIKGDFVWHNHQDTDETFIVLEGKLHIDFRDGRVELTDGEMFVVPKGVEHKPYAEEEVKMLLIEPRGVKNTGDSGGELTAENDAWI